jgi:2-hydroxychromene-2-carboxylate isomerase
MGELIVLAERLADRSRPVAGRSAFFFDLASPFSYLAAEQVERILGDVDWVPSAESSLPRSGPPVSTTQLCRSAERRAAELRLPLVWPDRFPARAPSALRAAAYARESGAGARFALAASRLAFCGGFDLEAPEILAEVAAAAGLSPDRCLAAAAETWRDEALHATARGLCSRGVRSLPAVRLRRRWLQGEPALAQAAALQRGA